MMRWMPRRSPRGDAAEDVAARAHTARELHEISGQQLLDDPRTNPATRGEYDRLRDAQQRHALELEHARMLRRGRVQDRRAAEAEKALEAIAAARESISPARAVTLLQRGRGRFLAGALAASILLSVGSAMGLAAVATHTGGPALAGWIAELCLTVATTAAILYRSHVDQASAVALPADGPWEGWRAPLLWTLVGAPLATSVLANLAGWQVGAAVSPINALCAVGAGVSGVFAFLVADVSARAIRTNASVVDDTDTDELRRAAMDEGVFTRGESAPVKDDDQAAAFTPLGLAADLDAGLAAVESLLQLDDDTRHRVLNVALDDTGIAETVLSILHARGLEDTPVPNDASGLAEEVDESREGHIAGGVAVLERDPSEDHTGADREFGPGHTTDAADASEASERVVSAAEARRLAGSQTRAQIASYLDTNPDASVAQIAAAIGRSESTVKRHLRELRGHGGER